MYTISIKSKSNFETFQLSIKIRKRTIFCSSLKLQKKKKKGKQNFFIRIIYISRNSVILLKRKRKITIGQTPCRAPSRPGDECSDNKFHRGNHGQTSRCRYNFRFLVGALHFRKQTRQSVSNI